jgi:hypothetical protein
VFIYQVNVSLSFSFLCCGGGAVLLFAAILFASFSISVDVHGQRARSVRGRVTLVC